MVSDDLRAKLLAKINAKNALRVKPDLRPIKMNIEKFDIMEVVQGLLTDKRHGMRIPMLKRKYLELNQTYPDIFKRCVETDMTSKDLELLKNMLHVREQMLEGKISQEDADETIKEKTLLHHHPDILEKLKAEHEAKMNGDSKVVEL
jgi:hypothetical protein